MLPTVEDFEQTVTVTAPEFRAPEAVKNSGFLVAPREILKSAAALQDVSRCVQGVPGVVIGTNNFRCSAARRGPTRARWRGRSAGFRSATCYRSGVNAARSSVAKSAGSSHAAKCPPRST